MPTPHTTVRLSEGGRQILDNLTATSDLSQSGVIEEAIRLLWLRRTHPTSFATDDVLAQVVQHCTAALDAAYGEQARRAEYNTPGSQ